LDAQDQLGLKFEVEKIIMDQADEEIKKQEDEEEPLDLEEIMQGLKEPINMESKEQVMNESYFTLRLKDSYKLYTFRNKHV
jgi:hypothetical protein